MIPIANKTTGHVTRLLLSAFVLVMLGCGADSIATPSPEPPPPPEAPAPGPIVLDGSWRALYWIAETSSGATFDVITEGGSIRLQVHGHAVTGSMYVPANVTNGAAITVSMEGTVSTTGDSVRFQQTHDTFVQRAVWKHSPGTLFDAMALVNQDVEGSRFTVVLVRNW